ncbi:MAG: 3',5'-cyclic-nucleotide phosphodiesterase [Syntrophorhabdaceae bacterium]|nr:3',5'-cyclic-nucleotide phosphodiesterase [Syntrophorhabdaceae bacterium]
MKIKALGVSGSGGSRHNSSSFLVDGVLLLDAGTVVGELSAKEENRIRHILLTHAHMDHMNGIPFLLASRAGSGTGTPVTVAGGKEVLGDIRRHIFNGRIWPDFSKIPSKESPLLLYKTLTQTRCCRIDGYTVAMERVNHTVPANGFIVANQAKKAVAYTGDTGPTDRFWKRMEEFDVKALITEISFPNRFEKIARMSGHLTPAMLEEEIRKISRPPEKIFIMHMKPPFEREIRAEVRKLRRKNLSILKDGDEIVI